MGNHYPMAAPFSDGVWFDSHDHLFKMWYQCASPSPAPKKAIFYTCYATSTDGKRWEKPLLDVIPGTNIVFPVEHDSTVVWVDADEHDSEQRYKLFVSKADGAVSTYSSNDGIHWSATSAEHRYSWVGDRNTVFYNPFRGVWVYSIRDKKPYPGLGRIRYYSESPGLSAGLDHWQPLAWIGADNRDLRNPHYPEIEPQLYALDAVAYESVMVGLFSIWEGPENKVAAANHIQKRNQIMLGFSRDGYHWDRPDRHPFLKVNETEGAWNWGNMQSVGGGFLVVGDQLYFYSSGRQRNDEEWDSHSSSGLFFLRRDGFASMDADARKGVLTTRLLTFSGSQLFVNFATSGGEMRVEALDEEGRVIPSLAASDCIPIQTDSTHHLVRWKDHADLSMLSGKKVRFRFLVERGELYSFWVSPDRSGASRGFVAAGGPGFEGYKDIPSAKQR
ncbi:MAG: hypothetical protein PW789_16700 [Edaphobacter sp.]|uniref:hypothetical protein n=1 Tax=Edaphobacter sp. TaxID=1934404 RepID=UPI002389ED94|nr:hypothetical protein [Edaphobacter sp.]MDE1178215.1 hypothetical protein [Edaphobacter sp.]